MHLCWSRCSAVGLGGFGFHVTNNSVHTLKTTSVSRNKMSFYKSCCSFAKNRPPAGLSPVSELEVAFFAAVHSGSILLYMFLLLSIHQSAHIKGRNVTDSVLDLSLSSIFRSTGRVKAEQAIGTFKERLPWAIPVEPTLFTGSGQAQ